MSPTVSRGQWWGVNTFACGCTQVVVVVYTHLCVYQTNRQLCCQRLLSSRGLISPRPVYNTQECKAVMICGLLACFNGVECGRLTVLPLPDHYTELTRDRDCHFVIFQTPPPKKDMDLINGGDNGSLHFLLLAGSHTVHSSTYKSLMKKIMVNVSKRNKLNLQLLMQIKSFIPTIQVFPT